MDVVTGAFSYSGRAIAEELLRRGREVRTLTRREEPGDALSVRIASAPLDFADPAGLRNALRGAERLFVTYWIRFEHGGATFPGAVERSRALFAAAREARVGHVVLLSVTNPSADSPLPYFRGKAAVERDLVESGLSHAIVRPTLVFGPKDILVGNIAWGLRRFPLFPVAGDGRYQVQPVSVEDVARLAVDAGDGAGDEVLDAAGPERYAYEELVRLVARAVGVRRRIVHLPPLVTLGLAALVGAAKRDVMLTRDELDGLMASLLVSAEPPRGRDSFREWLERSGPELGRGYVSELARNFRPYASA